MNQLEQTSHSLARLRQRGFREIDAQLIVELGTEVRPGLFMLIKQDVDALIAELSSFSGRLDYAWRGMSAGELKRRVVGLQGAAGECLILCVSDLGHAVFRYVQASKRPAKSMAS
jgi:hypothetical protein